METVLSNWNPDILERIAASDDLHIAALRDDLSTLGTLTWIWSVVVEGDLYVRAYYGQNGRWYKAAMKNKAGRITAAGETLDVLFAPETGTVNDRIDDAYRKKYAGSPYLGHMIGKGSRAATVKILPKG
ncbi:MAG: DUF2255 domain-containing protein [Stutzerimonas stutzeri]|nr:MAG: DUF2255 domain-containing protein [Stutzerimonas stutzeri]